MQPQPGFPLINRRTENFAIYGVLLILAAIGLFVVPTGTAKISAMGLLLLFALLHTFGYRAASTPTHSTRYFISQTVVVMALTWLARPSDAFNFLYFILGLQAILVLPMPTGLIWTALFYLIDSLSAVVVRGSAGMINLLFNLAAFLFTTLFGYALRVAEIERQRNLQLLADLHAAQDKIKELAVSEERNRLAREIHDGLGHYLTATTMQIQGAKAVLESTGVSAQASIAVGALGKAETLLQEALADVRGSVAALRITPGRSHSLAETLADLAHAQRIPNQLAVQFTQTGTPRNLNPQVELTLHRVAQEGLTNIHKHAHASHVTLLLGYERDQVRLTIGDDGRGTGTDAAAGGYGLIGLRERVQLVGGKVNIRSASGQGFQLEVVIPG